MSSDAWVVDVKAQTLILSFAAATAQLALWRIDCVWQSADMG